MVNSVAIMLIHVVAPSDIGDMEGRVLTNKVWWVGCLRAGIATNSARMQILCVSAPCYRDKLEGSCDVWNHRNCGSRGHNQRPVRRIVWVKMCPQPTFPIKMGANRGFPSL